MPVSPSASWTTSRNRPSISCCVATLTDSEHDANRRPTARQCASCASESRRMRAPRSTIRPDSSAIGRNWPGTSRPRSGCSHRASTSKPTTWPPSRSTIGWKYGTTSPRSSPRRSSLEVCSAASEAARVSSVNASTRSRPAALARYIAASASRSSSSAVRSLLELTANPMLAVTTSSCSSMTTGCCTARRSRSATIAGSTPPSTNTTNSSPPNRARRSVSRITWRRRPATRRSSSSPIPWPRLSLTTLKLSRSMNSTDTWPAAGAWRAARRDVRRARHGSATR